MRYILSNIPFFITLGVLALTLGLIFLSPLTSSEHKKFLRKEFYFCAALCVLTLLCDCVFTLPMVTNGLEYFATLHGYWWGIFVIITSNLYAVFAFAGMFMFLRAVPFCGKVLQWLVWCLMTIPARLLYLTIKTTPSSQHILDLFNVKIETTLGTVTSLLTPSAFFKACLPNIIVCTLMCLAFRKRSSKSFRLSAFVTGLLIFAAYCINPKGLPILRDSMGSSMNALYEFANTARYYFVPREKFTANSRANPQDNIVFILDESIRGDYVSANNTAVNTTTILEQYLHKYPANLFNYGVMLSASTSSFGSRSAVLTGQNKFPDTELLTLRNPTIFDIAKANGYRTILMNVQGDLPDLVLHASDMANIDEVYLNDGELDSQRDYRADFNAADFLRKRLSSETGLFIFLEKMGAHVPYEDRYPSDEEQHQVFMPKMSSGEFYSLDKRRKVINSYKNAVRYNLDNFFAHLFGDEPLSLKDCTIVYTSDHGQSFMEYGQLDFHTTGYLEQALVPFVIFSTDEWVLENLRRPDDISGTLSHLNIDPTLYAITCRDLNYSSGEYCSLVSAKTWHNPPMVYLFSGSVWTGKASERIPTDSDGKIILPLEKYMY